MVNGLYGESPRKRDPRKPFPELQSSTSEDNLRTGQDADLGLARYAGSYPSPIDEHSTKNHESLEDVSDSELGIKGCHAEKFTDYPSRSEQNLSESLVNASRKATSRLIASQLREFRQWRESHPFSTRRTLHERREIDIYLSDIQELSIAPQSIPTGTRASERQCLAQHFQKWRRATSKSSDQVGENANLVVDTYSRADTSRKLGLPSLRGGALAAHCSVFCQAHSSYSDSSSDEERYESPNKAHYAEDGPEMTFVNRHEKYRHRRELETMKGRTDEEKRYLWRLGYLASVCDSIDEFLAGAYQSAADFWPEDSIPWWPDDGPVESIFEGYSSEESSEASVDVSMVRDFFAFADSTS